MLGERLVLPPYVNEHLALGYASTKNAAQGSTVHTSHTVATSRTSLSGFYVPMTRGQEANTAYVVTLAEVEDPAQGGERHIIHRDPVAVLARMLDTSDQADAANRSAVATATHAATEAGSVRTAAELLADASQLAATERTATWLDSSPAPECSTRAAGADCRRGRRCLPDPRPATGRTRRPRPAAGAARRHRRPAVRRHPQPVQRRLRPHPRRAPRPARPGRRDLHRMDPRIANPEWRDYS